MVSHYDKRNQLGLALCAVMVIALGLVSRTNFSPFSAILANYPGDMLWALLVYVLVAFIKPAIAPFRLALITVCIAYAVEISQLYQAPWINAIRTTTLGHMVLGNGFDWLDLCAYSVGVAVGYAGDCFMCRFRAWM